MKDIPELTSRPTQIAQLATFWALMIIAVAIGYTIRGCI